MKVVILDTGCANLSSVTYAVQRLGYTPVVSREAEIVLQADKLFLPGVGTAQAAMNQLEERDLIALIKACTQPVLGICLGMQLLGTNSDENGGIPTLGIVDAPVKRWLTTAYRCRIWAGIRSFRRPDIVCSAISMTVPISISFTAMPCQSAKTRLHKPTMAKPSPLRWKKITSLACSSTLSVRVLRARSC